MDEADHYGFAKGRRLAAADDRSKHARPTLERQALTLHVGKQARNRSAMLD